MLKQAISTLSLVLLLAAQAGFAQTFDPDVRQHIDPIFDATTGVSEGYGPIFDPSGVPMSGLIFEPARVIEQGIGPIFDPSGAQ